MAHLAGDELEAPAGRLVVEEDARGGVEVVALAVVDGDPVAVDLGHPVGAAGVEGGGLRWGTSWTLPNISDERLVEADLGVDGADGVEHAGDPEGRGLTGQHRLAPRRLHERLRGQVVDLLRAGAPAGC